jgi:hypothetical protein
MLVLVQVAGCAVCACRFGPFLPEACEPGPRDGDATQVAEPSQIDPRRVIMDSPPGSLTQILGVAVQVSIGRAGRWSRKAEAGNWLRNLLMTLLSLVYLNIRRGVLSTGENSC